MIKGEKARHGGNRTWNLVSEDYTLTTRPNPTIYYQYRAPMDEPVHPTNNLDRDIYAN
jgi:hypothetical protein